MTAPRSGGGLSLSVLIPALLAFAAMPVEAQDLALLFPARYLELTSEPSSGLAGLSVDAFTGDYPYRVRGGPSQAALYTGIPLYFPLMVSLGSVNQLGYKDDYSLSTPLALFSLGYQDNWGVLKVEEGPFALWGWRWGNFSGGFGYAPGAQTISAGAGWFLRQGSLSFTGAYCASNSVLQEATAKLRLAFSDSWSLVVGVGLGNEGKTLWSLGVGTYLFEPPANALTQRDWDHVVAHRGSLLRAPENTRPAVELALREGQVEGVELDVQRTSDGVYVFVHDDFLLRYNGTLERVVALSGRELARRDFGRWFSRSFAGTRPMVLEDLAGLGGLSLHGDNRWVFDLKNVGSDPADAQSFLSGVARVLPEGAPILVSTGDVKLLKSLVPLSPYPLGLQVDVARTFFLWGDFFPPLLEGELESLVRDSGVTSFFLFSSKYANAAAVERVAQRYGLTYYLWNFHDRIWGQDPVPDFEF